jgi:predicted ATPase/DNA-binding winged helix-turn-helix (wHTH) protein
VSANGTRRSACKKPRDSRYLDEGITNDLHQIIHGISKRVSYGTTHYTVRFGSFQFVPSKRLLLDSGREVRIGGRALDILTLLVQRTGEVVTRDELIASVWPNSVVEDINLRVHIAALRRALGDGQAGRRYIVNFVGRGYSFVAPTSREPTHSASTQTAPSAPDNLPLTLTRMVGRATDLIALRAALVERRHVTIVGSGGVGKTTLALAVASQVRDRHAHGVRFVDLATLAEGSHVSTSIATALGLTLPAINPVPELVAFLRDKDMLILLDNCEHTIDSAASVVEELLKAAPGISVLATSREPLAGEGEWQYRLNPLQVPNERAQESVEALQGFSAVELFIERASTSTQAFELTPDNAGTVLQICRRLDGIPLVIELAAAQVNILGLKELAWRLDSQFDQITRSRRTALPRHQTLRAALDWSFDLLTALEQVVLLRLSIFKGAFTLESAVAVAAQGDLQAPDVIHGVIRLVDKSLLGIDTGSEWVRYRLLHTTRAYAFEKLLRSDTVADAFRWHALQILQLLRKAEVDWGSMNRIDWLAAYDYAIDDVRTAVEWAFSINGDVTLGAEITVAAIPFGFQMALIDEFRDLVENALRRLSITASPQPLTQSRLNSAFSVLNRFTGRSASDDDSAALNARAAEQIGIAEYQVGPILTKAVLQLEDGNYEGALGTADRLESVARRTRNPLAMLLANRLMSQAQHFCGNHAAARQLAERVLAHPAKSIPLTYASTPIDHRISMRILLSRILWLEGYAEQATVQARESIEYASSDSPFALCQALALSACPIAFWIGDYIEARRLLKLLIEQATRYRLAHWRAYARCFESIRVASARSATVNRSATTPGRDGEPIRGLMYDTVMTIDPHVVALMPPPEPTRNDSSWCAAEMLRIQGERVLRSHLPDGSQAAERLFTQSLDLAETQNALAWKLRAATSLARLWSGQGRNADSLSLLSSVYAKFSEGHRTRDLKKARSLIDKLESSFVGPEVA